MILPVITFLGIVILLLIKSSHLSVPVNLELDIFSPAAVKNVGNISSEKKN